MPPIHIPTVIAIPERLKASLPSPEQFCHHRRFKGIKGNKRRIGACSKNTKVSDPRMFPDQQQPFPDSAE